MEHQAPLDVLRLLWSQAPPREKSRGTYNTHTSCCSGTRIRTCIPNRSPTLKLCKPPLHPRRRNQKHTAVKRNDNQKPSLATLSHHVFSKGAWRRARLRDHTNGQHLHLHGHSAKAEQLQQLQLQQTYRQSLILAHSQTYDH